MDDKDNNCLRKAKQYMWLLDESPLNARPPGGMRLARTSGQVQTGDTMTTKQDEDTVKKQPKPEPDVTTDKDEPINISSADDVDVDEDNDVSDLGTTEPPPTKPD